MYEPVSDYLNLSPNEITFLQTIEQQMGIMADLSRADVLLYARQAGLEAVILAHAQPRSIAHVYSKNQAGRAINLKEKPEIRRALIHGQRQKDKGGYISEVATVTIPAGNTSANLDILLTDDTIVEPAETFGVILSAVSSAPADVIIDTANDDATGTIND